jgi:hypothetical protein
MSAPGDVVLTRPGARYPPAPLILAGRRVVFERFTPYLTQFADQHTLEVRHELVHRFFRTRDRDEAIAILSVFDVSWVCAFGTDRVRFPADGVLDPVFVEPGATIYRVRRPPSKASASTTSG